MKRLIGISSFLLLIGFSSIAQAQDKDKDKTVGHEIKSDAKTAGHKIKKGAKKVGNETAELASKGKARVTDEVYKDKVGPNGQTIYIDHHSKYYWIDEKGHKHYTTSARLKNKTNS